VVGVKKYNNVHSIIVKIVHLKERSHGTANTVHHGKALLKNEIVKARTQLFSKSRKVISNEDFEKLKIN
jgi:hypothetical protein